MLLEHVARGRKETQSVAFPLQQDLDMCLAPSHCVPSTAHKACALQRHGREVFSYFFQYSALLQLLLIMEYSLTLAMLGLILLFH